MAQVALAVVKPPQSGGLVSLYDMEETLLALVDSEAMVPAELEQQFLLELDATLRATEEKRDAVGHVLKHLATVEEFADEEIERLRRRKKMASTARERLEGYVVRVIRTFPADAKGKLRKLEGRVVTLSVAKCPDSVEVSDESQVPLEFADWSFRIPATMWEPILDSLDIELRAELLDVVKRPNVTLSKTAIKAAIEAGAAVPGAKLVTDKYALRLDGRKVGKGKSDDEEGTLSANAPGRRGGVSPEIRAASGQAPEPAMKPPHFVEDLPEWPATDPGVPWVKVAGVLYRRKGNDYEPWQQANGKTQTH